MTGTSLNFKTIPAIPTRYRGHHFRSRLEARWAVFFDHLGIQWEYEAEGYQLPSGKMYLPDFRLPSCGTYVEVRGAENRVDLDLIREAAGALPYTHSGGEGMGGLLLLGPIPPQRQLSATEKLFYDRPPPGDFAWPLFLPRLGMPRITIIYHSYNGRPATVEERPEIPFEVVPEGVIFGRWSKKCRPWTIGPGKTQPPWLEPEWDRSEADALLDDVNGAYNAARSARFEHGESGAT